MLWKSLWMLMIGDVRLWNFSWHAKTSHRLLAQGRQKRRPPGRSRALAFGCGVLVRGARQLTRPFLREFYWLLGFVRSVAWLGGSAQGAMC